MKSLKQKAITGVIWSSVERFSVQGIQFVFSLLIARILDPADYGLVAMLSIFLAVSQTFIDSGFNNALIRKADRTDTDYSTVFYFNIGISIVLYAILYISAPGIAKFYNQPQLVAITRVSMLALVASAIGSIQRTQITIRLDFRALANASLISTLCGGILGYIFARKGFGAWALVYYSLAISVGNTLLLWLMSPWHPEPKFSISSLKSMFNFGSKLLLSGLLDTLYKNLYQLVIGKKFRSADLGNYSRAQQIVTFPSSNISEILNRVTYPVLCTVSGDEEQLKSTFRSFLRMGAYVVFPLMLGLAAVSKPLVLLVLGKKWAEIIPLMRILCLSYLLNPVHVINLNILMVKGRSELFLRLEIIKKIFGVTVLVASVPFGVTGICVGSVFTSYAALGINTWYTHKLLSYTLTQQIMDLVPIAMLAVPPSLLAFFIVRAFPVGIFPLMLSVIAAALLYIGLSTLFRKEELTILISIIRRK